MITRKTILWTFLVLAVLTTVPPIISWAIRPAGSLYTGITLDTGMDFPYYLNLIEQSERGSWLFKVFMIPEAHQAMFFHPLFLAVGRFVALTGIAAIPAWHIFRLAFILVFLFVLRGFLGAVVREPQDQRWAFFAILFGGVLYSHYYETTVFLLLFHSPLSVLTILTTTAWFWLLLVAQRTGWNGRRVGLMAFLGLFQAVVHPYILLLWGSVPVATILFEVFRVRRTLVSGFFFLVPIAVVLLIGFVYLSLIMRNPVMHEWSLAARNPPWPASQMLLYSFVLVPLAVTGFKWRRASFDTSGAILLACWLGLTLVFSQLRLYPYAGRMMIAFYLPLAVFAGVGFRQLWRYTRTRPQWLFLVACILVVSLMDHGIRLVRAVSNWGTPMIAQWRYLDVDAQRAFSWIRENTPETAVLLHAARWETLIAQQTYRQVYCTYGGYTSKHSERHAACLHLYAGHFDETTVRALMANNRITHILVGPIERETGQNEFRRTNNPVFLSYMYNFQPERYPFLEQVFDEGGWEIYQVRP